MVEFTIMFSFSTSSSSSSFVPFQFFEHFEHVNYCLTDWLTRFICSTLFDSIQYKKSSRRTNESWTKLLMRLCVDRRDTNTLAKIYLNRPNQYICFNFPNRINNKSKINNLRASKHLYTHYMCYVVSLWLCLNAIAFRHLKWFSLCVYARVCFWVTRKNSTFFQLALASSFKCKPSRLLHESRWFGFFFH